MAPGEHLGKRVGRAAKTESARPTKAVTVEDFEEEPAETKKSPKAGKVLVEKSEPVVSNDDPPPSENHKAEMRWGTVRCRFAPETVSIILTDFIRSKGLFDELSSFAAKRLRR